MFIGSGSLFSHRIFRVCLLSLSLFALLFGQERLFASIQTVIFDQNGSGALTTTEIFTLEQPQGTVTDFQMVGSYPEESSFGAVAAWLENGTDIKAIIYAQNGSGSLSTSGVISVATGAVLDFRLSGEQPAEESNGAVIAWVENSGEIKAVIFQKNGSGSLTTSGALSLGTATGSVTNLLLVGDYPQDGSYEYDIAVAWLENGTDIKAIAFYYHEEMVTSSGIVNLATATGTVTDLHLSGEYGAYPGYGSAIAWLENGSDFRAVTFDYDGTLTTSGVIDLGSATGAVTDFQLVGKYPEDSSLGAAVAWIESGTEIKTIVFSKDGSGSLSTSGILTLGTSAGTATQLQLSGDYPAHSNDGSFVAWLENGTNIRALTFHYSSSTLTSSGIIDLGAATGTVSYLQATGVYPQNSDSGAAIAWVENGEAIKAIIFDKNGSGALTSSGIIQLGSATMGSATHFLLSGASPEYGGYGAVAAWLSAPAGVRSFKRPLNRR